MKIVTKGFSLPLSESQIDILRSAKPKLFFFNLSNEMYCGINDVETAKNHFDCCSPIFGICPVLGNIHLIDKNEY